MRRLVPILIHALLIGFLLPSAAEAHNIGIECKRKGDVIHVEAFYDDDTAGAKAKVEVLDASEKVVATGITDAKGFWTFPTPPPGKYEVRIDAGAGHRAKTSITVPGAVGVAPAKQESSPSVSETISEGPPRTDFTSTPWLKVAIGLVAIAGLAGGYVLASRIGRSQPGA